MGNRNLTITTQKFSLYIMAGGGVITILGIVMQALNGIVSAFAKRSIYDLPILLIIIGLVVVVYGFTQIRRSNRFGGETVFSNRAISKFMTNYAIFISLFALIVVICIIEPRFLQIRVILDIFTISSTRLIIATGICFSLLIAGTDLSAGRMVGLSAVISTSMLQVPEYANRFWPNLPALPVFLPIIIAVVACMLFGSLNGFLVAKFEMHPFIATLGVSVMVYGACSLYFDTKYNHSQPIGGVRPDFAAIGQTKVLTFTDAAGKEVFPGISVLIFIALGVAILMWFLLNKTTFGKNVYAIGGNREAAIVSGVNVFKTIVIIFILGSVTFGVGGVLEASRTAGATNNYGLGYELDAIAACVVGGVSLMGGIGKISGVVSGVLLFSTIQYGLQFINVSPMWQQVIKGVIIVVAVAIDMTKYRSK